VLEAAVYGLPHPTLGEEVAAAVRTAPGAPRDGDALRYAWTVDGVRLRNGRPRISVVFGKGRHTVAVNVRDRYRGVTVRRAVVQVV